MKFVGDVNGNGTTEVEAFDVDEAATKLAELDYESGDGSPPPQNEYLVSLLSIPDCEFFVRCVTIEFRPSFSASHTNQEPEEHVFDSLICEAQRAEKRGAA